MATFGELFKAAIAEQNLTAYGLAKETGFDRSLIQSIFTGRKKLPYNRFNEVINSTYFSAAQIEELLDKYFEEKFGIDKLNRLKYIGSQLARGCGDENYEEIPYEKIDVTPNRLYSGRENVIALICTVLNDNPKRLLSNFSFSDYEINATVYNICKKHTLDSFFHFVHKLERTDNSKLEILFNSLHYAEIGYLTHISDETFLPLIMPYFILTDKYFIKYDKDAENAYVMSSPEIIDYVEGFIAANQKHYTAEVQIPENALDSMYIIQGATAPMGHATCVGFDSSICATYLNLEMANAIATPFIKAQPGIIQSLFAHYNLMLSADVEEGNQALGNIITSEALNNFVETGRIHCIPEEYACSLSKKHRADYLEAILNDDSVIVKLTNSAFFEMDYSCSYQINDTNLIICTCKDLNKAGAYDGEVLYITDDIQTVTDFYDYYRYLSAGAQTFSAEKTKKLIQSAIDTLRAEVED